MSAMRESDDSEGVAEDEYKVERISKVRIRGGRKEYFLKWVGYPEEENTWEPEENLHCPDKIKEFEDRMLKERAAVTPSKNTPRKKASPSSSQEGSSRKRNRPPTAESDDSATPEPKKIADDTIKTVPQNSTRGFSRGLKPDRIIGATDSSGELMFLIKWKDSTEADLVPAREANVKCPQVVIRFYEERLTWHTPETRAEPQSIAATFIAAHAVTATSHVEAADEPPVSSTPAGVIVVESAAEVEEQPPPETSPASSPQEAAVEEPEAEVVEAPANTTITDVNAVATV